MEGSSRVSRGLSLYLDLLRFASACVVMLAHLSFMRASGGVLWQLRTVASDAVALFFVLSGFVIAYVIATRESHAYDYALARLSRMLSVALPALLLTAALDALGAAIAPLAYGQPGWPFQPGALLWQYFGAAGFVSRFWLLDLGFGSNFPYWSLCFEVWYYALFGLFVFAPPGWRWPAILALGAVVGPSILSLLPVWLLGVAAYRVCQGGRLGPGAGWLVWLGSIAGFAAYAAFVARYGRLSGPLFPAQNTPNLVDFYLVGLLSALHVVGFAALVPGSVIEAALGRVAGPLRWCAGASFSIYCFHAPVLLFLSAVLPLPSLPLARWAILLPLLLALLFALAAVTERRKAGWRRVLDRGLRGLGLGPRPAG